MKIYVIIFLATVTTALGANTIEPQKSTKRIEDYHHDHHHDHHHNPGGIWKTRREWKAHWIRQWELRKMWVPAWKKVWAPVDIKEWIPLPDHHDVTKHVHHTHPEIVPDPILPR